MDETRRVITSGDTVGEVKRFEYLGFFIKKSRGFNDDIKYRIKSGLNRKKRLVCNKRFPTRLKDKFYKSVVRPIMNGLEYWVVDQKIVQR